MSNILLSGGCGHIGSYLLSRLGSHNITIVDNMLTQRYCSLFNLPSNCTFIESSFEDLTVSFLNNFDTVIHLAGIVNATNSFRDTEIVNRVNIEFTKDFIDKVIQSTVTSFIFPSTTSVYGKGDYLMYEDTKYLQPQSPYATSKLAIEEYLKDSSLKYIILRLGTIFGTSPGMRFHTAINKFCYQAAFGQPLTIWKDNYEKYRPYLALEDMIVAMLMVINGELPYGNIYNVLTGNYKLVDIVKTMSIFVPDLKISMVDTPLINQYNYVVNGDKIRKYGYCNNSDISVCIRETLKLLGK